MCLCLGRIDEEKQDSTSLLTQPCWRVADTDRVLVLDTLHAEHFGVATRLDLAVPGLSILVQFNGPPMFQ